MIRTPAEVLLALEQECLAADKAIAKLDWPGCERSWRSQRRLTHELDIAMETVAPGSPEAKVVRQRIERLYRYREGQLKRLRAFNAGVAKRLANIERFRKYARSRGMVERSAQFLDIRS